jgi:hypothetical protein
MILILARGKLTYYEQIKDLLHDTNKDDNSKSDDISVEVDYFKDANEALENPWRMKLRVVMLTK